MSYILLQHVYTLGPTDITLHELPSPSLSALHFHTSASIGMSPNDPLPTHSSLWEMSIHDLLHRDDRVLASLFIRPCAIDLESIVRLLTIIVQDVDYYNLYTCNCWWFVGCIWSNLVAAIDPDGSEFHLSEGKDTIIAAAQLFNGSPPNRTGCDAKAFARIQQFIHLEGLKRLVGYGEPKDEMLRISRNIEKAYVETVCHKTQTTFLYVTRRPPANIVLITVFEE
ncbi:hypothetical protein JAAARDRAFT_197212 [Jaapia argillacea MUCL 33604]|uniref:Uncharacterized protein n=1 Tax=Jaapia argillacea MUCL 33604 TaxID=933084 RepID=A0A067PTV7_9AGAM|nr:hypothetical protein JAAARDRAFT_197212 [Jaapia argillacea MUCL 33604]